MRRRWSTREPRLEQNRLIQPMSSWPCGSAKGRRVECGSTDNLHFDHIIPGSRGGSSLVAENIQVMCARHNLAKHDKIPVTDDQISGRSTGVGMSSFKRTVGSVTTFP